MGIFGCHRVPACPPHGRRAPRSAGLPLRPDTLQAVTEEPSLAGRSYAHVYRVSQRADLHAYVLSAVEVAGGRVLYASGPQTAPIYLGIQAEGDERIGMLCYPFRCNHPIKGRAPDEHRLQVRYGGERSWHAEHRLGLDIAGVDVTVILGVHLEAGVLVGLDPFLYDPLPMGISIEFKDAHVAGAQAHGWYVWERGNIPGRKRVDPRARLRTEALVAFRPERLLDYVRFERQATSLGLDPPLRYAAAIAAAERPVGPGGTRHILEEQFALSSEEILSLIANRTRLSVAVRGGVAEHHLERVLRSDPAVRRLDQDAQHDFDVTLAAGMEFRVECKNVSPTPYANGDLKVEVQKTRASRGDPASRLYRVDQFDVVAACVFSATGVWEFRYERTAALVRHPTFPDRLAPAQRVTAAWAGNLAALAR